MTEKHALYLVKEGENDGRPALFAAEDVEAAKANGWAEPDFPKGTGEPWNAEDELYAQDALAEQIKLKQAQQAKAEKAESKKK